MCTKMSNVAATILVVLISLQLIKSAPIMNMVEVVPGRYLFGYSNHPQNPRIFWNSIGDFITNSGFFPIEVNVPDIINSIVSGASGTTGGSLQKIPVINRITSAIQPRPNQYYMLVPVQQDSISFQNFLLPMYP